MIENRVDVVPRYVSINRVIVSVYDKSNLETLIEGLVTLRPDIMIFSTGGTYKTCARILGSRAEERLFQVSDYTGQPEMHGGLVKTLDFKIYLGLLSEPYNTLHHEDLQRAGAVPFDMVVANLYPFHEAIAAEGSDCENARSNIDIGGPCMLRAAAKNYIRLAPVSDPRDYSRILSEMSDNHGSLSLETRFELAKKCFAHTAAYDKAISSYLADIDAADITGIYSFSDENPVQGEHRV